MSFRTTATPTEEKPGKSRLSEVLFAGLNNGGALKSAPQSFVKKNVPTVDLQARSPDLTRMFLQQKEKAGMGRSASPMLKRPKKKTAPIEANTGVNAGGDAFEVPKTSPKTWEPTRQQSSDTVIVSNDIVQQKHKEMENKMFINSAKADQETMERAGRNAAGNQILAFKLRRASLMAKQAGKVLEPGMLKRQSGMIRNMRRNIHPSVEDNEWHYATFGESLQTTFKEVEMAEIMDTASKRIVRLPMMASTTEPYPFFYTGMGPLYLSILECVSRMTWRIVAKFEELNLHPVMDARRVRIGIVEHLIVPTIAMQAGKVRIDVHTDKRLADNARSDPSSVPRSTSALAWSLSFHPGSREQEAARSALSVIEDSPLVRPGSRLRISTRTLSTALNGVWDSMSAEEKRAAGAWKLSPPVVVPEMYSFRVDSAVRK